MKVIRKVRKAISEYDCSGKTMSHNKKNKIIIYYKTDLIDPHKEKLTYEWIILCVRSFLLHK